MTKITFITHDDQSYVIDAKNGVSVMDNATKNDIPGIVARCGGATTCATCHVYVDAAWTDKINAVSTLEADMLDFVFEPKETSRLSCQIEVSDDLDGLILHIPSMQME
jgi:2Fe-2S ferredoxin